MNLKQFAATTLTAAAAVVSAQNFDTPKITMPLMKKAPVIDGRINSEEWSGAARMERFSERGPKAFPAESSFWVGSDGKKFFVAIRSEIPPAGIRQRAMPRTSNNAAVTSDDNAEIVIIPDMQAEKLKILHSIINNRGALYSQGSTGGTPGPWRGNWQAKGSVKDGFWDFEAAIPLADLDIAPGRMPKEMGIRICRTWTQLAGNLPLQSSWESAKAVFASRDFIPVITWDENAPVVQHLQLKEPGSKNCNIKVSIHNPGTHPVQVKALIAVKPKNSQPGEKNVDLSIAPGQTSVVEYAGSALSNETLATVIRVTSPDGKKTYYYRGYEWEPERSEAIFKSGNEDDSERLAVNFAYYPSSHKMRLRVDAGSLQNKAGIRKVSAVLKDSAGKELAATEIPKFKEDIYEMIWSVPDLKKHTADTGKNEYTLVFDIAGIPNGKVERKFVRTIMEWEGNPIGKSETIVAPFTPIEVKDNTLNTILRRHELNKFGLWSQVTAADQPLLKDDGMRLEAVIGGKNIPVRFDEFKYTVQRPARVETKSRFSFGAQQMESLAEWDYDGMMKWTLTLEPCSDTIDSLKLVIPLDNTKMPLMHTCTDGIRINSGGAVPGGESVIWDGSKCARNSLVGTYVPYIWLGDEQRGISVFGENDKGWSVSTKTPCQQLIRRGNTISLVLNLIAEPVRITGKRDIVIGFEATPVKPMPENWRKWNTWAWYGKEIISQFAMNIHFLGSCYSWGAPSPCLDIYPLFGDTSYWQKLAQTRKTGEIDQQFLSDWIGKYPLPGKPGDAEYRKTEKIYADHARSSFYLVKGSDNPATNPVMAYTNARGVRWDTPEGQTFVDEWHRNPFVQRKFEWLSGVAYDLDPVESFRDYAMWWYKQMITTGAMDYIYWDDVFMNANFNMVATDAYYLPDGSIQPSSGIFNMRELVRRTAVMQAEMGRPALNMVHMTNTAITPICAFARMNYDWEDHNGFSDFQDRYTREYVRALSIGRQFGNFSAVLAPISGTPEQAAWCERTATGVMLTHELRWTNSGRKHYWNALKKLYDFGYGDKDVKVYNYWDAGFPLEIAGPENSAIALVKNGKTMLIVCDYGGGGEYRVKTAGNAINLENGVKLKSVGGEIPFTLKKHDYIMMIIE